jgi:hypothetical protein
MDLRRVLCIAGVLSLAACSGGGGSSSTPGKTTGAQRVSGTITIVQPPASVLGIHRRPAFVSPSTGHAALFINGGAIASGSTTSCTPPSFGSGTGCTISWSANLVVPASYVFSVETDTGTTFAPNNTVLSEGSNSYAIVAGNNALAALSLNGVVKIVSYGVTSCTTSSCIGNLSLAAAAGNIISYDGATTVPAVGNSPSSGNVFDNGSVTFVGSTAYGNVTGSPDTDGANTYATYAAGAPDTLTISGVQPYTTGTYPYQVTCVAAATGTFGITAAGDITPSGDVTTAELATGLSPAVSYPAAAIAVLGTVPSFGCTNGVISTTTGTVPVN